jgi:hypothetical protein
MPKKTPSRDKRLKIDLWVTDGLRAAVGATVRDDGKPANDTQLRYWAQQQVDEASTQEVERFESHRRRPRRRGQ